MTKITQSPLATPDRSWLRKMSAKTMNSSQIQMKNTVNQISDQKNWPVPNSASTTAHLQGM